MNFYCDAIIFNHPSFNGILYIRMLIISDDTSKYKVKIGYSSSPLYSSFIFGIYLHSLDSQPIIIHFKRRFLDQPFPRRCRNTDVSLLRRWSRKGCFHFRNFLHISHVLGFSTNLHVLTLLCRSSFNRIDTECGLITLSYILFVLTMILFEYFYFRFLHVNFSALMQNSINGVLFWEVLKSWKRNKSRLQTMNLRFASNSVLNARILNCISLRTSRNHLI